MDEQIVEPDVVETPDESERGEGERAPRAPQTLALAVYDATPGGDIRTNIEDIIAGVQDLLADNRAFDIENADDLRCAKAMRADVRRARKAINDEYLRLKGLYERPLLEFQAKVRQATGPLDQTDQAFREAIDAYGRRLRDRRREFLADRYEELAPDIAALVPFDRFMELRGERGARGDYTWLRASMGEIKASDAMEAELAKVAQDWTALGAEANGDRAELDHLRAIYSECLDYGETLKRRSLERQREDEIRRQRAEDEEWAAKMAGQAPAFDDLPEAGTGGSGFLPQPSFTPEAPVLRWHVTLDAYIEATLDEARALGALLKDNGLTGGHITRVKEA